MSGEEAPTQQEPTQQEQQPGDPPPAPTEVMRESGSSPAVEKVVEVEKVEVEAEVLSYRALVLTGHGGYDKVKLQVITQRWPRPKAAEVQVQVKACGLNFAELLGRQGLYDLLPAPPVTMGMEAAGVIKAVGMDVKNRKVSTPPKKISPTIDDFALVRHGAVLHLLPERGSSNLEHTQRSWKCILLE